ncbi:MAG: NAD-dependent malic enzyme [Firmicutes bacterium]|nr:NAD-dependent malic enzyme [Bacillota bacterium]
MRLQLQNKPGTLGRVLTVIGDHGGDVGAIDIVEANSETITRDITFSLQDAREQESMIQAVAQLDDVRIVAVSDRVFLAHLGGKIGIALRRQVQNREDLSTLYTPGVGRVAEAIAQERSKVYNLTMKRNSVAIVTDGSAVLGLGDLGPEAALPVMEGKAMLFKRFANIDAFPLCLDERDPEKIVDIVRAISPEFGGINLEDIAAPRCFQVEERLREILDIPVFHDDQHGTAIVVLAGLMNGLRVVGKRLPEVRIVINGMGAAGVAITKILLEAGAQQIICCDKAGVLVAGDALPNDAQRWIAAHTNPERVRGTLPEVLRGADVFIGVSAANLLHREQIETMAQDAIVFALANPVPEIAPEEMLRVARVIATGRSDYPNQINNVLAFPGVFRGALDCRARAITAEMELAAARALADVVGPDELSEEYIIPSVFNSKVVEAVAQGVREAAVAGGVARKGQQESEEEAAQEAWAGR